jgi:hypothetical protein
MSSPAFVTCLQHHIPRTQQNQAFPVTKTLILVHKEIICATFGSSGNGLFAGFQELWVLLKSA